jgi:predicted XRE-type DNA-binding protein
MAKGKTGKAAASIPVTRGSGNVFADLGFHDAEELQVKAGLTRRIANRIKEFGLTQIQAATRLGISQPDVSKLMHGRYTGYSVHRLIAILNALENFWKPAEPAERKRYNRGKIQHEERP